MALSETYFDRQMDMMLDYVAEPVDRDEAREALENASQAELDDLLAQIGGTLGVGKAAASPANGSQGETATSS